MRWSLLLLLILNLFYYVWNQQQVPVRTADVPPADGYQLRQQDIRLLSESPGVLLASDQHPDMNLRSSTCLFFGRFNSTAEAETLRQRFAALDIDAVVKSFDAVGEMDYWVYLPPLASREASMRQLKELQVRQIDSFIIAEGDLTNGISLGIFPRYESAASVIGRLEEAGYVPALRKLARDQRVYWVRVAPESVRLIDESLLARLTESFPELAHELKPCEGVAIGQ